MLDTDIELAVKEVKAAENRFNNATENINLAINELLEAEEKLNNLIKIKKEGRVFGTKDKKRN